MQTTALLALTVALAAALPLSAALVAGDLVSGAFAVSGSAVPAAEMGAFFLALRWVGAPCCLYIAHRLWTAPGVGTGVEARPAGRFRTRPASLSVALGNPNVVVSSLALLPDLVELGQTDPRRFAEPAAIVLAVR